jgi:hypothetical protein
LVIQHQAIIGKPGADHRLQGCQVEAGLFGVANQVHPRQAPADKVGLHIKPTGVDGRLRGILGRGRIGQIKSLPPRAQLPAAPTGILPVAGNGLPVVGAGVAQEALLDHAQIEHFHLQGQPSPGLQQGQSAHFSLLEHQGFPQRRARDTYEHSHQQPCSNCPSNLAEAAPCEQL